MAENFSQKISQPTGIDPSKSIKSGQEEQAKPNQSFESYMKENPSQSSSEKSEGPSPFDLASQGQSAAAGPTHDSILGQMNSTSSVLGDLQNHLTNKNLKLRQSHKYLLRNKLTSANEQIRAATSKTGADTGPPIAKLSRQSPVNKFLGLLTDGQKQLSNAQSQIQNLNMNGKTMNPGDLLLVQVKLAKAQQELEYSSVLLSTAVSDIKTLFNIQL